MNYLIFGGLALLVTAFLVTISVQLIRIEKKIIVLVETIEEKIKNTFSKK